MADPTKTTRTPAIMVPVPELSRERRSALAFTALGPEQRDPVEIEPATPAAARAILLEVATKAIERAIDGASSHYREAMTRKYAPPMENESLPPSTVDDLIAEQEKAEAREDAEGNPEGDESLPRHGFFSR